MQTQIRAALEKDNYDCVIASQIDMAAYADCFAGTPAVFDELELGFSYNRRHSATTPWSQLRHRLTWAKHRYFVTNLLGLFQLTTVVSQAELRLARKLCGTKVRVEVIPNGLNLLRYQTANDPRQLDTLVFTGSFGYEPNYRAMVWFQGQVYPLIAKSRPNLRVIITGDHRGRRLPNCANVTMTNHVADVRPILANATCAIVPLQEGGGTRLKLLEAMAMRTPVVSTTKGAEGLEVTDWKHLLLADTPLEFANALDLLLASPDLRTALSNNAYALLDEKYNYQTSAARLISLIEQIASGTDLGTNVN
jgi:glycosyltransferase involved in cell wall biosynthesis